MTLCATLDTVSTNDKLILSYQSDGGRKHSKSEDKIMRDSEIGTITDGMMDQGWYRKLSHDEQRRIHGFPPPEALPTHRIHDPLVLALMEAGEIDILAKVKTSCGKFVNRFLVNEAVTCQACLAIQDDITDIFNELDELDEFDDLDEYDPYYPEEWDDPDARWKRITRSLSD